MTWIVDDTPPPEKPATLSRAIDELEAGQSLLAASSTRHSLSVMASRIARVHGCARRYVTGDTEDGPRVWRLK